MTGTDPREREQERMSDEELRAWTMKRGRVAALGFILLIAGLLGALAWSVLR